MFFNQLENYIMIISLIVLVITICFCLYRSIKGPRVTDTLLAINVINIKTICMICIFSVYLSESYLVDVSIIYSIIGFVAVAIFSKIIIAKYEKENKSDTQRLSKEALNNHGMD